MTERERILSMVADGTITVEEADRLLEYFEEHKDDEVSAAVPEMTFDNEETASDTAQQSSVGASSNPQSQSYSNIRGFDISWVSGPIEIRSYDGNEINVTEYSRNELRDTDKMYIYEENGILHIKWIENWSGFIFSSITNFFSRIGLSKHLIVEVPRELAGKIESLKCNGVSSKISLENLTVNGLKVDSTSGSLDLSGISAQEMKISSVSGAVRLNGVTGGRINAESTSGSVNAENISVGDGQFHTVSGAVKFFGAATVLRCNTVSGTIQLDLANTADKLNLDSVSGSQKIWLNDDNGFEAKYSAMSGKFEAEFPVERRKEDKHSGRAVYLDGYTKIKFSSVSGSMRIYRKARV